MFRGAKKTVMMLGVAAALSMSGKAAFGLSTLTSGNSTLSFNPTTSAVNWVVDGVDQFGGTPAGSDSLEYYNGTDFVPFSTLTTESSSVSGNIGTATFGGTLDDDNFTITVKAILTGGATGSGSSAISETITVNNLGPASMPEVVSPAVVVAKGPVNFIIQNAVDANVNATPNDDTLTLSPAGGVNTAVQTDPTGVKLTFVTTPNPTGVDGNPDSGAASGPTTGNESFLFTYGLLLDSGDTGIISDSITLSGPSHTTTVAAPNSAWNALAVLTSMGIFGLVRRTRRVTV